MTKSELVSLIVPAMGEKLPSEALSKVQRSTPTKPPTPRISVPLICEPLICSTDSVPAMLMRELMSVLINMPRPPEAISTAGENPGEPTKTIGEPTPESATSSPSTRSVPPAQSICVPGSISTRPPAGITRSWQIWKGPSAAAQITVSPGFGIGIPHGSLPSGPTVTVSIEMIAPLPAKVCKNGARNRIAKRPSPGTSTDTRW